MLHSQQTHSSVENERNHRRFHILRQLNSKSTEKLLEGHQIQPDISLAIVATPSTSSTDQEKSWRSKFPHLPTLILGSAQFILTDLIIILEIAALGLSTYKGTGAGIWCSIVFLPTAISTFLLGYLFFFFD